MAAYWSDKGQLRGGAALVLSLDAAGDEPEVQTSALYVPVTIIW